MSKNNAEEGIFAEARTLDFEIFYKTSQIVLKHLPDFSKNYCCCAEHEYTPELATEHFENYSREELFDEVMDLRNQLKLLSHSFVSL